MYIMAETILQNWIFTQYAFPFLFMFFLVFGILEKSKFFGDKSKQLHAGIAFVVGLIFVGFVFPKLVVANLLMFLTVAIVTMFVGLLLWGFVAGDKTFDFPKELKIFIGVVIFIALIVATLWATGVTWTPFRNFYDLLFYSSWSQSFWTNATFVIVIIIGLALAMSKGSSDKK